ncbi:60S ribosomal protein L35a-3 [Hordeum vulgare]|nr:60S ribosomal protein L35a-3 [Hordeum vulgare]
MRADKLCSFACKCKRIPYVYKTKTMSNDAHYHYIYRKVSRPHGNTIVVRSKFTSNLPAEAMVSEQHQEEALKHDHQ